MPASPATSSAKRVHLAHWMQRSRSMSTSGDSGSGLSQWRFSSTNRRLSRPVGHGLVLEGAFPAFVAHRAVQGDG